MVKKIRISIQVTGLVIWAAFCISLFFWGYSISSGTADTSSPDITLENLGPAPGFSLPDLYGKTVSYEDMRGKTVLVNFWGTWCKSCCEEMPALESIYRSYKSKGFEIAGIAVEFHPDRDMNIRKVRQKVSELGMTFTVLMGNDRTVTDFGGKAENFPQTYLIDSNGQLRKKIVGARKKDFWEALVRTALEKGGD